MENELTPWQIKQAQEKAAAATRSGFKRVIETDPNGMRDDETFSQWLKRTRPQAFKPRTPEQVVKDEAQKKRDEEERKNREIYGLLRKMISCGLPELQSKTVLGLGDEPFKSEREIIFRMQEYFSNFETHRQVPWIYVQACSGNGKTTAACHFAAQLISSKSKSTNIGYYVYSEMIDLVVARDLEIREILNHNFIIIDDFMKKDNLTMKAQDVTKNILDQCSRQGKILGLFSDLAMKVIYDSMHDLYREQVYGRIVERCGRGKYMYGIKNQTNFRLEGEMI